ncbi:hypothetical protein LY78DRAFT_663258 [Colletotrichum sublineola]|nr:hypothetical protein LY78DRAFT_663258 [Colletotrichum sublineola]
MSSIPRTPRGFKSLPVSLSRLISCPSPPSAIPHPSLLLAGLTYVGPNATTPIP